MEVGRAHRAVGVGILDMVIVVQCQQIAVTHGRQPTTGISGLPINGIHAGMVLVVLIAPEVVRVHPMPGNKVSPKCVLIGQVHRSRRHRALDGCLQARLVGDLPIERHILSRDFHLECSMKLFVTAHTSKCARGSIFDVANVTNIVTLATNVSAICSIRTRPNA